MKFSARSARPDEALNIDPETDRLPQGVTAVDFGEFGVFVGLKPGSHVVEVDGVRGLHNGQFVIQVHDTMDGGFLKRLEREQQ